MNPADYPVWWANVASVVIFIGIAIAVYLVPKETIYNGAPDKAAWRDIRVWAVALVVVQLIIYAIFA